MSYSYSCILFLQTCHWYEKGKSDLREKAQKDIEDINFVIPKDEMDVMLKYCLFWMVHFPTLLLFTWKQLKDVVPQH